MSPLRLTLARAGWTALSYAALAVLLVAEPSPPRDTQAVDHRDPQEISIRRERVSLIASMKKAVFRSGGFA